MEESKSPQLEPLNEGSPRPTRRPLLRTASEEEFNVASPLSPNPRTLRSAKTFQIDQDSLVRYKRILQKRVAWAFILLFVVIIERIFSGYARNGENSVISSLQQSLGISYESSNWYLQPIVFLENYLYFVLLLTHYFIIIYYFYNTVACMKIMYTSLNVAAIMALLEIFLGDPRPFWDDANITGAGCESSYGFPSFTVFSILFLFMYSWHCFQNDDPDEERVWDRMDVVKCAIFVVLFGVFCFLKILAGYAYISQIFMTILYTILFYYLAIFFNKALSNLVEKSSIDVQAAKRYIIFWMVYILILAGIAIIAYGSSSSFLEIDWFSNYFTCLEKYNLTSMLKDTPYYHLLGAWGSFLNTGVLFVLLGAVFGAAKAFRDFKGVLWYATTTKNRAKMTAIASLCVLPSWVLAFFQPQFIMTIQQGGLDAYLFNAIHFSLLYFALFGLLPKYVFNKWNWLNRDSGYFFVADEMIKIENNDA